MWARRTKSITTAQMSIFKLVKLQSLVGKCWKTRKMKPGDVCEFVYTVYLYYARKKLHFRANFGLIQIHTKVLESSYIHANACRYLQSLYTVSSNIIQMESSCKKTNTNPGGTRTFCSAINCTNSKLKNPNLSFFRFPSEEKRYEN